MELGSFFKVQVKDLMEYASEFLQINLNEREGMEECSAMLVISEKWAIATSIAFTKPHIVLNPNHSLGQYLTVTKWQ